MKKTNFYTDRKDCGYGNTIVSVYSLTEDSKIIRDNYISDIWGHSHSDLVNREVSIAEFSNLIRTKQEEIMKKAVKEIEELEEILNKIA